jgi:hypothetical protein
MSADYGPGKYDDACTAAREATEAAGVILIVLGGQHGSGFSVQCRGFELPVWQVAAILRQTAKAMEDATS